MRPPLVAGKLTAPRAQVICAGHVRVPFIPRWPLKLPRHSQTGRVTCAPNLGGSAMMYACAGEKRASQFYLVFMKEPIHHTHATSPPSLQPPPRAGCSREQNEGVDQVNWSVGQLVGWLVMVGKFSNLVRLPFSSLFFVCLIFIPVNGPGPS